ncbi:MAG: RNA ligase family protein [Myxococcaceae bacterium]|nr:RNA ligase family protein [Myxococcaceae bacterium]
MGAPLDIVKFPRTPHLEGSELQPGDDDVPRMRRRALEGEVVVTEKLDGINIGLRFDASGRPWLFSRAHLLGNEPWFDRLKAQVAAAAPACFARLGDRYVLYGEWLYAKHTVFYDSLSAYLFVFDALELGAQRFLGTAERRGLLSGLGFVEAPELWRGPGRELPPVEALLGRSRFASPRLQDAFEALIVARGLDLDRERAQTELSGVMEGLAFRLEREGRFVSRCKFVRPGFRQAIASSGSHWASRPLVPNLLAGVRP